MALSEDAFDIDVRRKWMTPKQILRVSMLTQYIFGMMDIGARNTIAAKMTNPILRISFLFSWSFGLFLARLRWRLKFWAMPLDFWIFTQVRKYLKLI